MKRAQITSCLIAFALLLPLASGASVCAAEDKTYDVVYVDVYAGSPYVPFHVTTVEFFQLVHDALDEDGIVHG